jgi:hypothetical protein
VSAIVIAIAWMYFWHKVAQFCADDKGHHLLLQSWACVDFPVTLVLISYTAWNVSDRYYAHNDTISVPVDFLFQLAYSYALFVGILNTQTCLIPSRQQNTNTHNKGPGNKWDGHMGGGDTGIGFSPIPQNEEDILVICNQPECKSYPIHNVDVKKVGTPVLFP